MRGVPVLLAPALVAGVFASSAGAHHSIAKFDGRRVVRIEGTVAAWRWINPHVTFEVDTPAAPGTTAARWIVEMQAPTTMMREGWDRASLVAGDHVIVFANPVRDAQPAGGGNRALYAGIILPDGRARGRTGEADSRGE